MSASTPGILRRGSKHIDVLGCAILVQGACAIVMTMTPLLQLLLYIGFTLSFFTGWVSRLYSFSGAGRDGRC
jgi:hypothetical protein